MKHGSCASANQSKCTGLSDSKQLLTGHEIGYYCLPVCVNASLIGGIQTGREEGTVEGRGGGAEKNKDGSVELGTNYRKGDSKKNRFKRFR